MRTLLCAGLMFFACIVQAHADGSRIGVVDTERILRESEQAVRAEKKIEREFASRDQEIKKLIKQSKDLQASLEKDGSNMSDPVRRTKERELANMNLTLQTLQREFREDLNLRKNEELTAVLAHADKAIREIAESEQYDVILQEAVYRNPKVDITDKVLKYLANEAPDKSEK
ncbi:chaperone protein Skp precursor [mine drainage metagenome]|uniref:Chaperone protein Skp n=1 Tax=mine drainage metagenome TaxID=410659 RepID=A0A1J5TBE3_9ZZZZ